MGGARIVRARGARCAVPAAASDPAAAPAGAGRLPDAAGATVSAPSFLSAGTPTPRAPCSVLPSPALLAAHSDMEGAAAPAAGPDSGPGAPGSPPEAGAIAAPSAAGPEPRKPHGVKRHHHKHNLKHRYELQETLGKGTYGKVKRATERFSGRVVSWGETRRARSRRGWGRSAHATGFGAQRGVSGPRGGFSGTPRQIPHSHHRPPPPAPAPRGSGVSFSRNTCYILSAHILGVLIPAAK